MFFSSNKEKTIMLHFHHHPHSSQHHHLAIKLAIGLLLLGLIAAFPLVAAADEPAQAHHWLIADQFDSSKGC
jgi:hypothetical protein